jgi:16S rRNA processing protein RimM
VAIQKPEFLTIARIFAPFGVIGELKVGSESEDPLRLKGLEEVSCLLPNGVRVMLHPQTVKARKDGLLIVKFAEYEAPETAMALKGGLLQVKLADAQRKPGQVLYVDMLGLQVIDDATGNLLGVVSEVLKAGQDLLEIQTPEGKEVLLPWVEAFVKHVDLENQVVRVTPIPGLFDTHAD